MNYDNLIAGPFPIVRQTVKIGASQTLLTGTVLGKKTVTAGAKAKFSFALSALTAGAGSVTATIEGKTYEVETSTSSSIDNILGDLAAAINADTGCKFRATANTADDELVLEANTVGVWANSVDISMDKVDVTITIGSKTTETAGVDASSGEYYAVDSSKSDGTQEPIAVLLEDVTTSSATGLAVVALTGEFNVNKLIFGGSDDWADHETAMRKNGMFIRDAVCAHRGN